MNNVAAVKNMSNRTNRNGKPYWGVFGGNQ